MYSTVGFSVNIVINLRWTKTRSSSKFYRSRKHINYVLIEIEWKVRDSNNVVRICNCLKRRGRWFIAFCGTTWPRWIVRIIRVYYSNETIEDISHFCSSVRALPFIPDRRKAFLEEWDWKGSGPFSPLSTHPGSPLSIHLSMVEWTVLDASSFHKSGIQFRPAGLWRLVAMSQGDHNSALARSEGTTIW